MQLPMILYILKRPMYQIQSLEIPSVTILLSLFGNSIVPQTNATDYFETILMMLPHVTTNYLMDFVQISFKKEKAPYCPSNITLILRGKKEIKWFTIWPPTVLDVGSCWTINLKSKVLLLNLFYYKSQTRFLLKDKQILINNFLKKTKKQIFKNQFLKNKKSVFDKQKTLDFSLVIRKLHSIAEANWLPNVLRPVDNMDANSDRLHKK